MYSKMIALIVVAIFQVVVLVGMVATSAMPLWTGEEIKIKTIPVDPRSLFRGNYALLRYDISEIKLSDLPEGENKIRQGEIVYVSLQRGEDEYYQMSAASLDKPSHGIYLRGRIQNNRYHSPQDKFRVKYGIEAFFAPKQSALALEKQLRNGGVAILMVSSDGTARLKDVIAK